mmetsp:Transcript_16799/g.23374  ORF Transcript_16799/g.23374 Transcript_16799/m.23374 type:complete len:102 (-) Transcript_16799:106-411(-)
MSSWSTGLFGCFDDIGGCIITIICPCITIAQNRADFDGRSTTCMDYCCSLGGSNEYFFRQHIRAKYGMPLDEQCSDCCATQFCVPCVLCQHRRELKKRGHN